MRILLSIKPEYVYKILAGTKKFEYRRTVFKNKDVDSMVIYATLPEGLVVAEVEVLDVLSGSKTQIWQRTKEYSGISRRDLFTYFEGKKEAHAIQLGKVTPYIEPKTLKGFDSRIKSAPQSFIYL
ncbi:Predicted transcriptional regulator [Fructobacillus evanidus]|uniref:ASCH domain-containing protein n=1 Tax=Fructobacillus evanidus TaxID=3064281 RepID=UPI002DA46F67|nr:Predicted transcriptional regulator [Fructobacillus sp. LMG 32999]